MTEDRPMFRATPRHRLTEPDHVAVFSPFFLVPLIEIALFIQVGGLIGVVAHAADRGADRPSRAPRWCVSQGAQALARLRDSFDTLRDPTEPLAPWRDDPVFRCVAADARLLHRRGGVLPCWCRGVRNMVLRELRKRVQVQTMSMGNAPFRDPHQPRDTVIDGSYTVEEMDEAARRDGPSGWTRH